MDYRIEFTQEAADGLQHLNKIVVQRIINKLKWLSQNFDALTAEVLSGGFKGLFKLRVGGYRVIYSVNRGERLLTVHLVGTVVTSTNGSLDKPKL